MVQENKHFDLSYEKIAASEYLVKEDERIELIGSATRGCIKEMMKTLN